MFVDSTAALPPPPAVWQRDLGAHGTPQIRVLRRADFVLPISQGFARNVIGKGVPAGKVKVIPHWADETVFRPVPPDSSLAKFLEKRGEGLHHICLEVDNIDAALQEMQEKGAPVLDKQPRIAAEGRALFLHPKGTNGVLLELLEKHQ